MEAIAIRNIQSHFLEILEEVRNGKKVGILYDGIQTPVAMIVPYFEEKKIGTKSETLQMRRQRLIKYPDRYDPLALAGAAEDSPLDLTTIRKEWMKKN